MSLLISVSANAYQGMEKWSVVTGGNIGSSVAIDDASGNIYVGSVDKYLYSFTDSGSLRWKYDIAAVIGSSPSLSNNGNDVYIGDYDGRLTSVSASSGTLNWTFTSSGRIYASPAVSPDGTVVFGSSDGNIYAINPSNGQEKWRFSTGGEIGGSPVIDKDGYVYFGSADGYIYGVNPNNNNPQQILKLNLGGEVSSPALNGTGTLYVGSYDNKLYAVDIFTKRILWSTNVSAKIVTAPVIAENGTVYALTYEDSSLNAISSQGSLKWKYQLNSANAFNSPVIGKDGKIYVGVGDKTVFALNPSSYPNMESWQYVGDSDFISSPAISNNGTLYIVSKNSALYAIETSSMGLAESDWPGFGNDSKNRRYQVRKINIPALIVIITSTLL